MPSRRLSESVKPSHDGWAALSQFVSDGQSPDRTGSPSPPALPRSLKSTKPRLVACEQCSKPILEAALPHHKVQCAQIRARQATAPLGNASPKKRALSISDDDDVAPSSKAKSTGAMDDEARARAKKAKIADSPTAKGSSGVNLNRVCGVPNKDGVPCNRSLTCTSHSARDKRAVQGRGATYDVLLAEWQSRKPPVATSMAKKPSNEASAPKPSAAMSKRLAAQAAHFGEVSDGSDRGDDMDSEDEVEAVLAGVRASLARKRPLDDPSTNPGAVAVAVRNAHVARFSDSLLAGFHASARSA